MASDIIPGNIDGTFPIAGIDNDTQGFRTNFTNTSTNFTEAKSEIEDLQSKSILKAPLTGESVTDNVLTTLLTIAASDATSAGLNIAEGVAPTAPNDGDVWITAGGAFNARLDGVTVNLAVTATTAELEDNTDAINTGAAKVLGYAVLNTTTGVTVFAAGLGDSDVWHYYNEATAHTPV